MTLPCDELASEGITDMATVGRGVAGSGEAMAREDVGRVVPKGEDGAIAEVDEGIGDAEGGEKRAEAFEGIAFQDAGEVEDNRRPTPNPSL